MPRPLATEETERRVRELVAALFDGFEPQWGAIAELAARADVNAETVRQLLKNPKGRNRFDAGFFLVADVARARGLSLDDVAAAAPQPADDS